MVNENSKFEIKNVGVIGVGKLGLAYALMFEKAGFNVYASSYKQEYVQELTQRKTNTLEPQIKELLSTAKNIEFTVDNHKVIDNCDIMYVMVATPSTEHGDYDVSAVENVANDFLTHSGDVSNKTLIIGSTVNPGTTDRIQNLLKSKNVNVVYSPTFVAQGSVIKDLQNPHTLSLGTDSNEVAEICRQLFLKVITDNTPVYQLKPLTAEILKLAGNCRATLLISYYNMIGQILLKNNLQDDLDSAMRYLNYIKFGTGYKFGFGFGGPCYPRDNRAFAHYTEQLESKYIFGELVDDFNDRHGKFLADYLLEKNKEKLPFYFEFLTYKKGVDILEESHYLKVCKLLLSAGANVYVEDTEFVLPEFKAELEEQYGNLINFEKLTNLEKHNLKIFPIKFYRQLPE